MFQITNNTVRAIKTHCLILFSVVFYINAIVGQVDSFPKSVLVIQPQVHIGKMLKINPDFPKTNFTELNELNVTIQTAGSKEWHQQYHFPEVGIALFYGYLGNNDVFGQSIAAVPNIAFNTKNGKQIWLQTRVGMGFSYFTKHYNIEDNPTNLVIGSSITNMTFMSIDANFKLSSHLALNAGVSYFHCSNGHYQLPNLGANMPSANIGISYFTKSKPAYYKRDSITKPNKKIKLTINFGYGRHEFGSATKATGGPKYPVFQGTLYLSKRWRKISNLHLGLFLTYYSDYYDFIVNQETFDTKQHLKAAVVTVFIGHEFMIGKFGLVAQSGINVYTPFLKEYKSETSPNKKDFSGTYITNKIGIHYYIFNPIKTTSNKLYLGIYMKANFGTADFAELAIGYTF